MTAIKILMLIALLPSWACIFNILLIASVLFPLRIGGAGNWAGVAMFLGLLFLV